MHLLREDGFFLQQTPGDFLGLYLILFGHKDKAVFLQVNCGDRDCDGQPCEVADFTCPQPTGLFPDPDNCIMYQDCKDGSAMRETCPLGRISFESLYRVSHMV